jgi:hypothetical protein
MPGFLDVQLTADNVDMRVALLEAIMVRRVFAGVS